MKLLEGEKAQGLSSIRQLAVPREALKNIGLQIPSKFPVSVPGVINERPKKKAHLHMPARD